MELVDETSPPPPYSSWICPLGVAISSQMEELRWAKSEFPVHWISEWTIVWRSYWLEIIPVFNEGLTRGFTLLTRGISSQSTSAGPPSRGSRDRGRPLYKLNWVLCCLQVYSRSFIRYPFSITESTGPSCLSSEIWTNVCLPIMPRTVTRTRQAGSNNRKTSQM